MQIYLETERLILRYFAETDADDLFDLNNDPEVMHYLTGGRTIPREEIERETLPRYLSHAARTDGYGLFATVEKSSGAFIGWFHLIPAKGGPRDEPELGYRLHKSAWGKRVRHRGVAGADPQGLHGAWRTARDGQHHGCQHAIPARHGEGWHVAGPHLSPGMA
jgi:hypothetical protein